MNRVILILLVSGFALAAPRAKPAAPSRFQPDPKLPPDAGVPYVILTTDALAPSFQKLADWKRATGMPAQVVSVDWLSTNPFYPGSDLPEKIYALLKDLRLNWRTRWVVLGGDADIVPPQRIRAFHGEYGGNQLPCDVYYADILPAEYADLETVENYGWSVEGERYIGDIERGKFDLVPELHIGRIPAGSPAEADAFFEKYLSYVDASAKDTAWLTHALVVGAKQFRNTQELISGLFQELGGKAYSTELLVEKEPDAPASVTEGLNKGCAFFDFLCHGCQSHFWVKDDHTNWGVLQLRKLKNEGMYPVVFANSCDTAEFDKPDCLAVEFLTQPKAGGVAFVGYTNVCFQSPVNREMYRLLFGGGCPELGRAMDEAKRKFAGDTWVGQILQMFGDPEMWVRTGAPVVLKTSAERFAANAPGRVTVSDAEGKPVRYARVVLDGSGTYAVGLSDEKGVALLPPAAKAGPARLAVLAQNGAKFEKKVTIEAAPKRSIPRPAMVVDDSADEAAGDPELALHGNNRKDLNPGETVKVVFSWPKDQAPGEGTWDLSLDGDRFVTALGAPKAEATSVAVPIRVTAKVPPGHQSWLTLSFKGRDDADPWTWTFRQPVEGAFITCLAVSVDDALGNKDGRVGWEDAGKKIRFGVGLWNRGTMKAEKLKLTLASEDKAVTLQKGGIDFGVLAPDEFLQPRDKQFEFQIAGDYDGHALAFTMTIEDDRRSKWQGKIVFTVPPAPPMLLKAESGLRTVALSWIAGGSAGVTGYHVYRSSAQTGPWTRITSRPVTGATTYPDATVKPSFTYWYTVSSMTADGLESRMSPPVKGHTLTPLPKGGSR